MNGVKLRILKRDTCLEELGSPRDKRILKNSTGIDAFISMNGVKNLEDILKNSHPSERYAKSTQSFELPSLRHKAQHKNL